MDVPTPAVPAFLTAGAHAGMADGVGLEAAAPFAWRTPPPMRPGLAESPPAPLVAPAQNQQQEPAEESTYEEVEDPPSFVDTVPASLDDLEALSALDALRSPEPFEPLELPRTSLPPSQAAPSQHAFTGVPSANVQSEEEGAPAVSAAPPPAPPVPGGYELPVADLPDSEWPEDLLETEGSGEPTPTLAEIPDISFPALDEASISSTPTAAAGEVPRRLRRTPGSGAENAPSLAVPAPEASATAEASPALKNALEVQGEEPDALTLVADDSVAAVLRGGPRRSEQAQGADDDDDAVADSVNEVSFVRAARRKAFWRQRWVRGVLLLVALVSLAVLALQVAVQERDRIAAMDPRTRPWLVKLCEPLRCEIAPPRQIADVVIDSSSFNKARGDSYQLAITMKNQSGLPLAMPAVELTLTDAQDQPVLRRVLLPTDLAAPAELPARGEWSASVAVIVTTGGARVAGYRLLAFYP